MRKGTVHVLSNGGYVTYGGQFESTDAFLDFHINQGTDVTICIGGLPAPYIREVDLGGVKHAAIIIGDRVYVVPNEPLGMLQSVAETQVFGERD